MQILENKIFGRVNKNGNIEIFYEVDGEKVTKLLANVYPIDSNRSAKYEHPNGIVLSKIDAKLLKITIEK